MTLHPEYRSMPLALALLLLAACGAHAQIRMKVIRGDAAAGPNLVRNPGFEELTEGRPAPWMGWQAGFEPAPGAGRDGSAAVTCIRQQADGQRGASQTVTLDQQKPMPIIVRGWSRAADVSGTADRDYALYCDLSYTDGTPLWGQVTPFGVGTHDWEQREVMILPAKPVRSITVHCLFRGHTGQVWFDDVELHEIAAAAGSAVVDGVPVVVEPAGPQETVARRGGGLVVSSDAAGSQVTGVAAGGVSLPAGTGPGGWLVRDVAANSDFIGFAGDRCDELGLVLDTQWTESDQAFRVSGTLRDTTGKDRAVTLLLALPIDARGGRWGSDIRGGQLIDAGEYSNPVSMGTGATGTMAQYPFSCVCGEGWGVGLGIDLNQPCQYRLAYNADTQQYFAAFDLALVPDSGQPSVASFGLVLYGVDPQWGFRSAAQGYYELFPEAFACRSRQQGIWMPFSKISKVEGWEDFGFRYKEGNDETAWDDEHDILTFRYTEPSTWWMPMPKDMPRTYEAAMAEAKRIAEEGEGYAQQKAKALLVSGLHDEQGRFVMQFLDTPWCDGAVFSMSCLPGVEGEINDPKTGWNEKVRDRLYGAGRQGDLDGEYLDSLEGYVTSDVDFRRDHFRAAHRPLTFTRPDCRPVIHLGMAVDEFVEWIATDVHGLGKLMMANSVPRRFTFLSRHFDVMGTETNWLWQGGWQPMDHASMGMIRTLCAQRPYLFLMNTDFDALEPYVERYFQRALFYGMYPSMFSPVASTNDDAYWETPRWYNRDRALHRKYQPLVRRVAEAGWQPITLAWTQTPGILLERFGPNDAGEAYVTVFNDSGEERVAEVRIGAQLVGGDQTAAEEIVSGDLLPLARDDDGSVVVQLRLRPEECGALRVTR